MTKLIKGTVAFLCLASLAILAWLATDAHAFASTFAESTPGGPTVGLALTVFVLDAVTVLVAAPTAVRLAWKGGGRSTQVLGAFVILVAWWPLTDVLYRVPDDSVVSSTSFNTLAQVLAAAAFLWFAISHAEELGQRLRDRGPLVYARIAVGCGVLTVLLWRHDVLLFLPMTIAAVLLLYMIVQGMRILRDLTAAVERDEGQRIAWILNGMVISFALAFLSLVLPESISGAVSGWMAYGQEAAAQPGADFGFQLVLEQVALLAAGVVPLVLVSSVALSVFYRGSVDAELMLERTTITSLFGFIFLVLFAVIEQVVSMQLDRFLTIAPSVGVFVSAAAAAIVVAPLHGGVRKVAARLVPERRETASVGRAARDDS